MTTAGLVVVYGDGKQRLPPLPLQLQPLQGSLHQVAVQAVTGRALAHTHHIG